MDYWKVKSNSLNPFFFRAHAIQKEEFSVCMIINLFNVQFASLTNSYALDLRINGLINHQNCIQYLLTLGKGILEIKNNFVNNLLSLFSNMSTRSLYNSPTKIMK